LTVNHHVFFMTARVPLTIFTLPLIVQQWEVALSKVSSERFSLFARAVVQRLLINSHIRSAFITTFCAIRYAQITVFRSTFDFQRSHLRLFWGKPWIPSPLFGEFAGMSCDYWTHDDQFGRANTEEYQESIARSVDHPRISLFIEWWYSYKDAVALRLLKILMEFTESDWWKTSQNHLI
jgi:hypothetical protein